MGNIKKARKAKANKITLVPYMGRIEGDVVPVLIEGLTGEKFLGRDVVMFNQCAGLFGTRIGKSDRHIKLTLFNGILNQCTLSTPPTPYWAVMDAMCQLKTSFTRTQVIEKAVMVVGEFRRKACEFAWDVLRNHHRHTKKRDAGMAYMIDVLDDGTLSIRARGADETLQYFIAAAGRKRESVRLLSEHTDSVESADCAGTGVPSEAAESAESAESVEGDLPKVKPKQAESKVEFTASSDLGI